MAGHENADAFILVGQATIPIGPQAPRTGREAIDGWLHDRTPATVRADAILLTSELISNSVRHSGMPTGSPLHITAAVLDGIVRIAITDHGAAGVVRRRKPGAAGGYGLDLVQQMAARWGVESDHGTQVWFELVARPVDSRHVRRARRRPSVRSCR